MNTITIQNDDGTFTIFDADTTTLSYDGTQVPKAIFTGTLASAQKTLDFKNKVLGNIQIQIDAAQATVDAITNYNPDTTQTDIQDIKNNISNKTQLIK